MRLAIFWVLGAICLVPGCSSVRTLPNGVSPDDKHKRSIWASDFIPTWQRGATPQEISDAERRLGVKFPDALVEQLRIQKGGTLVCLHEDEFENEYVALLNRFPGSMGDAAIDGILQLEKWELASKNHWFKTVKGVEGLDRLVRIAGHSESQLCLDYRGKNRRAPGLTYFFVAHRQKESVVCDSVVEFIDALAAFKAKYAVPALEKSGK